MLLYIISMAMLCDVCRYFSRDFNHTHRTACDCL